LFAEPYATAKPATIVTTMSFISKIMNHVAFSAVYVTVIYQSNITQKRKDNNHMKSTMLALTSFIAGGITMMVWVRRIFNKSMGGN
jgi:hypothetical protein